MTKRKDDKRRKKQLALVKIVHEELDELECIGGEAQELMRRYRKVFRRLERGALAIQHLDSDGHLSF